MVYSYRTLLNAGKGLYKEKGSKFLAFAYPVNTEVEIKEKLDSLKKEYFDARHHCYAWMLGLKKFIFEPLMTASPIILRVILS